MQGRSYLKSKDNAYCCLGVLCEISDGVSFYKGDNSFIASYNGDTNSTYLPESFAKSIGMNLIKSVNLAKLNDSRYSFNEIANIIEKDPEI